MDSDRPARDSPHQALTALSDRQCRAILVATADDSLSIPELAGLCDIPTSTAYRKVNMLMDVGLLEENPQIDPGGPNTSTYRLQAEEIRISIDPLDGGAISVRCSIDPRGRSKGRPSGTDAAPIRISPDGG